MAQTTRRRARVRAAVIGVVTLTTTLATLLILVPGRASWGADHIDGPATTGEPTADITDLFAFTSPAGRLVVSMVVHPNAGPGTRFSDALQYVLRIRRVQATDARGLRAMHVTNDELRVVCTADAGAIQKMTCTTDGVCGDGPACAGAVVELGEVAPESESPLRVFAGMRADPFFVDAQATRATLVSKSLQYTNPGNNAVAAANSLAIVAELDAARLGLAADGSSFLGVVAETRRIAPARQEEAAP